MANKIPLSAVLVCYNEAKMLPRCLDSLNFCDEIVVVDLGSTDNSLRIAKKRRAIVIKHDWVPIGEMARAAGLKSASHKWLLFIDPDEAISPELAVDIADVLDQNQNDIGIITVPWLNYVHGKVLKGTIWGGFNRRKRLLMYKGRVELNTNVHSDYFSLKPGFKVLDIPAQKDNFLLHYWLNDYRAFFNKHRRYLKLEGDARYVRGDRIGFRGLLMSPWRNFKESYFTRDGYKDGLRGLGLSVFWAWYNTDALIRLKVEQIRRGA